MPCTRGCAAPPMRASCPIPVQPAPLDYRIAHTSLPRVLCLGDSIGGPSCRAAATHPLIAGKLELRPIQFARSNSSVLLNSFGAGNLQRCVSPWMEGACKPGVECPKLGLRWRGVVLGAGAWDLQSRTCCEMTDARMKRLVDQVRGSVETALRYADVAIWMTTTPAAEHAGCCSDDRLNYTGHAHRSGAIASIGYCHHDAITQNRLVAQMLQAAFSPSRVAIADTYSAVASSCGDHYADCAVQPQTDAAGHLFQCNVHFTPTSFEQIHGPAIARALSRLALT